VVGINVIFDNMQIIQIESGPVATIGYLVIDTKSMASAIIDTPLDSASQFIPIIEEKGLELEAILLTHTHWDHTADCSKLLNYADVPVYVHEEDNYRLINPMSHTIFPLPFNIEAVTKVQLINTNDKIKIGELEFEVIHTPGHTEGGVCYVEHNEGVIFSGDTIFHSSIGRVDLPGGSESLILHSIKSKLMALPDDYIVYAGHGPSTTIGRERKFNPFLV
jgi:glyoxylase-like metal-dependent hydrolase (beta-lactamase superfamily II)